MICMLQRIRPCAVGCQPLDMLTMVARDQGGLGFSKTPSSATIRDQLAEKRRLDHHDIGKSMVDDD